MELLRLILCMSIFCILHAQRVPHELKVFLPDTKESQIARSRQVYRTKSTFNPFSFKEKLYIKTSQYEAKFAIRRKRRNKAMLVEAFVTDGDQYKCFNDLTTMDRDYVLQDALKAGKVYLCHPAENIVVIKEKDVSAEVVLLKAVIKDMLSGLVETFFNKYGKLFIRV